MVRIARRLTVVPTMHKDDQEKVLGGVRELLLQAGFQLSHLPASVVAPTLVAELDVAEPMGAEVLDHAEVFVRLRASHLAHYFWRGVVGLKVNRVVG